MTIAMSYRREDSQAITGRLFDRLSAHFGRDAVFQDIDSMAAGEDFRLQVEDALKSCAVLIVIIGRNWRGPARNGIARIHDELDPVRIEVEIALRQGVPIIPVLIGPTKMPSVQLLPTSLASLVFRHGCRVDPGEDFDHHADRLIREIERAVGLGSMPDDAPAPSSPAIRIAPEPRTPDATGGRYGIAFPPADDSVGPERAPSQLGGYARSSLSHYPGRYLVVRPAFKSRGNVYAYLVDIAWDEIGGGLVFQERSRQDTRHTQQGRIWIPSPSDYLYLVSGRDGWLRSITLSFLDDENEMRGIVSTLHNTGGARYVPVAAPIVFVKREADPGNPSPEPDALGELTPDHPRHAGYWAILRRAMDEDAAQIITL